MRVTTSRHSTPFSSTLALSMLVSFLRRNWAALKPTRAMRSISEVVYTMVSMARVWPLPRSSVFLGSPKYRPPVSSRTTRMSMPSPWRSGRSGQA